MTKKKRFFGKRISSVDVSPADGKKRKNIIIAAVIFALAAILVLLYFTGVYEALLIKLGLFKEEEVAPNGTFYEYTPKGTANTCVLNGVLLVCDESGIAAFDKNNVWQWDKEMNLVAPRFTEAGDKVLVVDIGGTGIHAFDSKGFLWSYNFDGTIIGAAAKTAKNRTVILHEAESYKSALTLLDFSGDVKALATRKFGEYHMISASLSEDGQQIAASGVYSEAGKTASVITFLKSSTCEVFGTETQENEFLPVTAYLKNNILFAAGGDSIRRLVKTSDTSTSGDTNESVWDRVGGNTEVVCTGVSGGEYFIAVFGNAGAESGLEASCTVTLYDTSGKENRSFQSEGGVKGVRAMGKTVVVYTENEVIVYNIYGQLIGRYDAVSEIVDVDFISERILVVCGLSKIARVDFTGK